MTLNDYSMTMNPSCPSMEKIPLKRPRLGPPDLYPQDPKQKEDELTVTNVKQGFSYTPQLSDAEFGSACKYTVSAAKLGHYFRGIMNKKQDLNTLPDSGKKRQQINTKDNWAVTARSKNAIEAWFKDLAGQKPLTALAKKVPIYLKREEIFTTLSEYGVPIMRAAWFIKMTSAHSAAISEAKIKKRQLPDPSQEWTQTLTKFLKEQLGKIQENLVNTGNGSTSPGEVAIEAIVKNWRYCCNLGRYMYDAGLLDKQEWLSWILDLLDKCRTLDDGYLKALLPLVLQFVDEFNKCELLARKLAYACAKKLNILLSEGTPSRTQSPLVGINSNGAPVSHSANGVHPAVTNFNEYMNCPFHRSIILILSSILQCIVLDCPTALIWNCFGEGRVQYALIGSPLDMLPCAPSSLPMPPRPDNSQIRLEVKGAEEMIRQRSRAVEVRWSSDKLQQCTDSTKILKVLNALDSLDRHSFDKVEPNNSIDSLYSKIFPSNSNRDSLEIILNDEPLVQTLCEWATCTQRSGEHRAMVVAKLLEKRQNELMSTESDLSDDKDSVSSMNMIPAGLPVFQNQLFHFLDTDAPVIDENTSQNRTVFSNLVLLFYELVRHDVFSHHDYMCTLISRGDIINNANPIVKSTTFSSPEVVKDTLDSRMEIDDSKIDADLGKLLQHIQQRNTLDNPDSPKDEGPSSLSSVPPLGPSVNDKINKQNCGSRHLLFTTHFPLPQDDWSTHECNQRYVLLYGFGKSRDNVKKITKEISKLYGKKFSIDTADGKVKRQSRGEFNFEAIVQKFHNLSYYDQHVVTSSCITTVTEMLSSFSSGNSNHIPVIEHISFLCDLLQMALNIHGLLEFCVLILKELQEVEAQLESKGSNLVGSYTAYLSLYTVGVLRKYHCCLLVSQEQVSAVFEYLLKFVKPCLSHPHEISSAERCILAYLFDLHKSCSFLHTKQFDTFTSASSKIKATLFAPLQPSKSDLRWNLEFMSEYFPNPKKKIDSSCLKLLNENPANRYSFVCNAVIGICNENDNEKLNDIGVLCAELTAGCNALAGEWLGVLEALCCSSTRYFIDVLTQVDVTDLSIHNNLAVFTAILIARHCFSLQDFVVHVALPSLVKAWNEARGGPDAEPGARLTCHLLLRLFKTVETPQIFPYCTPSNSTSHSISNPSTCHILYSCDRNLLAAAHTNIGVGPVLAVLKGILVLGDAIQKDAKSKVESTKIGSGELSISYILGTNDSLMNNDDSDIDLHMGINTKKGSSGIESANLSDFAKHVLIQICSQDWVRDKCLQSPEKLCSTDFLLDSTLKPKQAQRLLHMICHPENPCPPEDSQDQKKTLSKLLEGLDQWQLCVSWLNLHLMYKQYQNASNAERESLLTNIAEAVIQVFQTHTDSTPSRNKQNDKLNVSSKSAANFDKKNSIWLVAPLVSKLSSAVQSRVLWAASQVLVLETGTWTAKNRDKEKSRSPSLLSHLPFLSLVQTCLKGQDGERDPLLTSLKKQLEQFLHLGKEEKLYFEDERSRQLLLDALQLRFSLVGMMFDTIMESSTVTSDWAILLVQLTCNNVVDLNNNLELFPTVIDMLGMLIHSTLVCDTANPGEENKKQYQTLVKKLKKEVQDKVNPSLRYVKQLLPLTKHHVKVITCEPMGTLTDTKGNRIQGFDLIDKKQGLQVSEEQKISPWDLLEGHKNPAPLSWAWFGAVKLERKPLKYEEAFKLQLYHVHSMKKPENYYLEPPPLPPEDLEPPPEKVAKEEDKGTEVPNADTVGRATSGKKQSKQRVSRKKRMPNGQQMMTGINSQPSIPNIPFQHTPMYQQGPGPHWGYNQSQPYYNQQPLPMAGTGPRLERCNAQSKEAISQMLRNRHPNAQYMAPQPFQNINRDANVIRGGMQNVPRHSVQNPMYGMQQGMGQMYPMQQSSGGKPTHIAGPVLSSAGHGPGINQSYATAPNNYNSQMGQGQPIIDQSHGMINQGFSQSNFVNQNPVMNMPGQGNVSTAYMGHSGINPQMSGMPQRNTQYSMGSNMGTANVNPVANQPMYSQQGVTQAMSQKAMAPVSQFNQTRLQQQQQQQMQARMRQQMLMQQQQQQQQQQPTADQIVKHQQSMQGAQGPQSTAALVAHLQRSLSSGGQQQQMNSGVPQQHNPYHQTY